jgi:hypothetical protein
MSNAAATKDSFVPFDAVRDSKTNSPGALASLKVVAKAEAGPAFAPLTIPGASHAHAGISTPGKPVVTLQRDGDRVTAIRIECICGQIIELSCSY